MMGSQRDAETSIADATVAATERKHVFHTLDGVRGVAAIAVAFYHYATQGSPLNTASGPLAVDLFFMMSGVVLGCAYSQRLGTSLSVRHFFVLRLIRLYPLYLLGTAIGIAFLAIAKMTGHFVLWTTPQFAVAAVCSLLMLPSPPLHAATDALYPFNPAAWSLLAELVVNLVFASVAWTRGPRGSLCMAAAGAVALVAAALFWTGRVDGGWLWQNAPMGGVRVVFPFFIGVWMWTRYQAGRGKVPALPPVALLLVVAAILWFEPGPRYRLPYDLLVVLALFPAIVWFSMQSKPVRGIRLLTILGLVSYPLYVIHEPIRFFVPSLAGKLFGRGAFRPRDKLGPGANLRPIRAGTAVAVDGHDTSRPAG